MDSKTFTFKERPSTFSKNTTRKYFTAGDGADMKKSSILFSSNSKEEPYTGYSTSSSNTSGFGKDILNSTKYENDDIGSKTKSQTMYASMIVGKSNSYNSSSGLSGGNNVRELNDKAE